jgi:hypothetical protein
MPNKYPIYYGVTTIMTSSNRGPARTGFSLTGIASKTDSESPVITLSVSESDLTGVNDDLGPVSGDAKTMRSSSAQISVPTTTPSSSSLSQRQILTGIFSGLFFWFLLIFFTQVYNCVKTKNQRICMVLKVSR